MSFQPQLHHGTSGQFIIEIDATGTETLLTYDTTMTFTNKPTNLKFYADSSRTQELIVENETYLALNGFMSLEDTKKRDIPIYWNWPLETGNTEKEIEDNDAEDTTFIGKTMSMQISTTGTQVMSNPYANSVASTTVNGRITNYNTVQAAIDAAGTNQGAVVTLLADAQESVTIAATQDIVLNMNGKTLSSSEITMRNYGKARLVGNGTISANGSSGTIVALWVFKNSVLDSLGNINVSGEGTGRACVCQGKLNIYNGNYTGSLYGITPQIRGELNIFGGKVSGEYGIVNQNSAKVNIYNNAEIEGTRYYALVNSSNTTNDAIITIYGGTIIGGISSNQNENVQGQVLDYR